MARKSLGKAAKVLGGLGAMYALSKLPVGAGVRPEDIEKGKVRERLSGLPLSEASAEEMMAKPLMIRGKSAKEIGDMVLSGNRAKTDAERVFTAGLIDPSGRYARSGTGAILTTEDDMPVGVGMKKGGAVKGWGKARGARKAKVY
jgi:hypothetical protein